MQVFALVKRDQRRDVFRPEGRITPLDDILQILRRDLLLRDIQGEDLVRQLLEGVVLPFRLPVGWERRHLFRDEEATIRCKTLEDYLFERQLERYVSA